MSKLKVRQIDFQFGKNTPFFFNPTNMAWSKFVNSLAIMALHFERYIIGGTRKAIPLISDPELKQEAELFCRQEAQHSRHHRAHLNFLLDHCPELADTNQRVKEYYAQLDGKSLRFNLAYSANVELLFGPIMKYIIENRQHLFGGGAPQISSFVLWHFVEEFEHRHTAHEIYNEVVGNYLYRLMTFPFVLWHFTRALVLSAAVFSEIEVRETGTSTPLIAAIKGIAWRKHLDLLLRMSAMLLPFKRLHDTPVPGWAQQWFEDEDLGAGHALLLQFLTPAIVQQVNIFTNALS